MSNVQPTVDSPTGSITKPPATRVRKNVQSSGRFSAVDTAAATILLFHASLIALLFAANIWYLVKEGHLGEFAAIARNPDIRHAALLTLWTSIISSVLALCFAIPIAYALSRSRLPGRAILDTLVDTPIVLPNLVVGVVLLVFFQTFIGKFIQQGLGMRFIFAPAGIVLAQFICVSPYAVRTIKSAFDGVDRRLEDVSRTLGWSSWQTFLRVTLPMIRNGIVAAGVIAWALSMGLYGPLMIFAGTTRQRTEVLATSIYLELSIGKIGAALAITMVMVFFTMVSLLIFKRIMGGKQQIW